MTTYNNTDKANGFEGVTINVTLESEIQKRIEEVEQMNEQSNWTKEMEEREIILDHEIKELQEAQTAYGEVN